MKIEEEEHVDESSTLAGGDIKGFMGRFGSKPQKKSNPSSPFGDEKLKEVVKPKGNQWVIFDDDTGEQVGSYPDRETAWEQQRLHKKKKGDETKRQSAEKKRQVRAKRPEVQKAFVRDKPKQQRKPRRKGAPRREKPGTSSKIRQVTPQQLAAHKKVEAVDIFKEAFRRLISENMLTYVFESDPEPQTDSLWNEFSSKLSRQTIMADEGLKKILVNMAMTEARLLAKAVKEIKGALREGPYQVRSESAVRDQANGGVKMSFEVMLPESQDPLTFSVKIENSRPLIQISELAREALNTMNTNESKFLRAELMHVQETVLNRMDELIKASKSRDRYLRKVENNMTKVFNTMGPLEAVMMRRLMRKNKGVK